MIPIVGQTFRCQSTGDILDIPVQTPPTTTPFILLSDIQNGFGNVDHIRNGRRLVPFLKDENLEPIKPLRIGYYPGVELEVIARTRDQADSTGTAPGFGGGSSVDGGASRPIRNDTLTIADTSQSLNQIFEGYQEKLQEAMAKNNTLEEQLLRIQRQQQQAGEELVRDRESMMVMQREALDNLVNIHSRVQAVLTQTYELHEYLVPHLFIVLPRTQDRPNDRLASLFSENLRVHFLCEYATCTVPEGSKTQHGIHLAKHEGYELVKSTEFFERYGPYLILMLQMVQYGFFSAGSIIQPVENKVVEDSSVLNDVVKGLQEFQLSKTSSAEWPLRQMDLDKVQSLNATNLRQMRSYLKIQDEEHSLGNLFRIVTAEGEPKWVCIDCLSYHRGNYRKSAIRELRDFVVANAGRYIAETSRIEVKLRGSNQAREFYAILARAGEIQELEITLKWDATMDDFKALANAVSTAKVIDLTVDGTHFKGTSDIINRKRRFNPIMQLAFSDRIKYLKFQGFGAFFTRVDQLPSESFSRPRVFSIESGLLSNRKAVKSFNRFLEHRPPLTTLVLRLKEKYSLSKTTTDILSRLSTLQSLTIYYGEVAVTTNILEDKTRDVDLTIERINDLLSNELMFIKNHQLSRLAIKYTVQESDEDQLVDILRHRSRLMHLRIGSEVSRASAIINLVLSTREEIIQEGGQSSLSTFELMEEKLIPFDDCGDRDESTHIQTHVSFTDDPTSFDMRSWIRLENRTCITDNHPLYGFVRQHGWSIVFMEEDWAHHSAFAAIFDDIPGTRGFLLETLSLEVSRFTTLDFERLDSIIQQSPNFKHLGLRIKPVTANQSEIAQSMLRRYGSLLFKLHLYGISSMQWLQNFASLFPTRASFPNLVSFEVSFESDCVVSANCVRWMAAMISSPSQISVSFPLVQVLSHDNFQRSTGNRMESTVPWKRMRKIMLNHVNLQPEEWKVIIDAIDFNELQHLDLRFSNLNRDRLNELVSRVPASKVPLKILNVECTVIQKGTTRKLKSIFAELRDKVPQVEILTTATKQKTILWRKNTYLP